ncbi:MAG: metallopeptidase family protein [Syntrophomonadaceae bacterium]
MKPPTFDEFADMLEEAVNKVPPHFCKDLNGGFNLQKETKREKGYYILGEYIEGTHLGCFINFYYGSFVGLLGGSGRDVWEAEIVDTVYHEMQHHMESKAGRDDLARQEMEELARALQGK